MMRYERHEILESFTSNCHKKDGTVSPVVLFELYDFISKV